MATWEAYRARDGSTRSHAETTTFPAALGKEATPVDFGNFNSAAVKNEDSRSSGRDLAQAFTVAANVADQRGGQAFVEYRLRDEQTGPGASLKTNEVRVRFQYTF